MERNESIGKFEAYLQRRFPGRRTSKDYSSDLRQFMMVCHKDWQQVDKHDIDAFVDQQRQRGLKSATVKRRAAAIKTFFEFLAEEEAVNDDPHWRNPVEMKRHAGKQGSHLPRDLSNEAVEQLWSHIRSPRDQAWFALMLRAGLRVGEVAHLQLEDIMVPVGETPARLRVCGKGQKERMVPLSADGYAVLQAWLQVRPEAAHRYVLLNERDGGRLLENGIEYCLTQYGRQANVAVTPHQLRHTYARQLTEAGMPVTSLARLMGHAQVSTTQIYTAGADPELASAYQQAMQRLSSLPLPLVVAITPPPAPPLTACLEAVQERADPDPDWASWDVELPAAIRVATLAFVQRRQPHWKVHHRGQRAKKILGEFHRFWICQLQRRPIQQPGELTLHDLHQFQIQKSEAQVAAKTADYTIRLVLDLLQELADQGDPINPTVFRFKPRPRPESLPRHLPEADAQRLEHDMLERLKNTNAEVALENACYYVLAHTGLRAGECLDLRLQDLDIASRRLMVRNGKGQRDRVVYLSDTACRAVQLYLDSHPRPPQAHLFIFPDGRPISYMWLYEHLQAVAQAAGVAQVSPHRLRHTLATRLLNAGMEITRIQKLLGHEHVNTTMIYARVHDQTVEADYRSAMQLIERQQMPFSSTPIPVADLLIQSHLATQLSAPLDNSV